MEATCHLVQAPPGVPLLRQCLDWLRTHLTEPAGRVLWLTPSTLSAQEARGWTARQGGAMLGLEILSLEECLESLLGPDCPGMSSLARSVHLDAVLEGLAREKELPYFESVRDTRGFRRAALGTLEEFESAGLEPRWLESSLRGHEAPKIQECARLFARFRKAPEVRSARIDLVAKLSSLPEDRWPRWQAVLLQGFSSLAECDWRFLDWIRLRTGHLALALPCVAATQLLLTHEIHGFRDQFTTRLADGCSPTELSSGSINEHRPASLAHLQTQLYAREVQTTQPDEGVCLIEAPGEVGEARMVARKIRRLLAEGTTPEQILVTGRDLSRSFDLLEEVFTEYGIPVDLDAEIPLARVPVIRTLLRALRLADDEFPFAGVTELLRSSYLRPEWSEAAGDAVLQAEGLLRTLNVPRGREQYLKALNVWAASPPEPLEDEEAELPRRRRKSRLAGACQPFLVRFFAAWDSLPEEATPAKFAAISRELLASLGIGRIAETDPRDRAALEALWRNLDTRGRRMRRAEFWKRLSAVANTVTLSRWTCGRGRVRIVPAEEARHLSCEVLFVLGLGEGIFPAVAGPPSLLNHADRQRLRESGAGLPEPADRHAQMQWLFWDLAARPGRKLVLSYAALDEKGQPCLPGSALRAVQACFTESLPTEHQRMLVEGIDTREPLSLAEARVQFALVRSPVGGPPWASPVLPSELIEHLDRAAVMARERFAAPSFGPFDGMLNEPGSIDRVAGRFAPERVLSPTALETYAACPFRFLMQHVLRLGELEEPEEEVEATRRGAAFHRALSRFHKSTRDPQEEEAVRAELSKELKSAVEEYRDRAGSRSTARLWELEGERLDRAVGRYPEHWNSFLKEAGKGLVPFRLEADFGMGGESSTGPLVIRWDGEEVRLGGRIDRVDAVEDSDGFGFVVIDYKTGRKANYTSTGIKEMTRFQLPLYALAIETLYLPEQKPRMVGMGYWLVTDGGYKSMSKGLNWEEYRVRLERRVVSLAREIRRGKFPLFPSGDDCTAHCPYARCCRIAQSRGVGKVFVLNEDAENCVEVSDANPAAQKPSVQVVAG